MKRRNTSRANKTKKQRTADDSKIEQETVQNFPFLSLLPDLQVIILKYLEKIDLMMTRLCCKHLQQLIDDKIMLIYLDTNERSIVPQILKDYPNVTAIRLDDCKYDAKKLPTPLLKLALYDSKYPYIGVDFNRFTRLEVLICNLDFPVWIPNFLDLSANLKSLKLWSSMSDTTAIPVHRHYDLVQQVAPRLSGLQSLAWDYISCDDMLALLKQCTSLVELTLEAYQLTSSNFAHLPSTLTALGLWNSVPGNESALKPEDCHRMTSLVKLYTLNMDNFHLCNTMIKCLPRNLHKLVIYNCDGVDTRMIASLSTNITCLKFNKLTFDRFPDHIKELQMSGEGLSMDQLPSNLTALKWSSTFDVNLFKSLPANLQKLSISATREVIPDMVDIVWPQKLTALSLKSVHITDEQLLILPTSLTGLEITKCSDSITDNGIKNLTRLVNLKQIAIKSAHVTQEGFKYLPPYVTVYHYSQTDANFWLSNIY